MIEGMKNNREDMSGQDALVAAFAGWTFLVWLATLEQPKVFLALLGVPFGCAAVFSIIRWTNRRHDPRYSKRPPDPP